jgi:phosphohistidine phosphatase
MKTLLILRHAKSSWKNSAISDHARPLNKRGRLAAPCMGQLLYEEDLVPEIILSSTARRTVETTELLTDASGFAGEIIYLDEFYQGSSSDYIYALLGLPDDVDVVMVVGHNPGVEALLETLTDEMEPMPTAALAYVQLPINYWYQLTDEIEGELLNIWRPRDSVD